MIVRTFQNLRNWLRYERLHHYPELQPFSSEEALKRLKQCEAAERLLWKKWIWFSRIVIWSSLIPVAWFLSANDLVGAIVVLGSVEVFRWSFKYFLFRRVSDRVQAKVTAELGDGRLWTCVDCGYDLRANAERCSECGAAVARLRSGGATDCSHG